MASFSSEWDDVYARNKQMSLWPWSDLVSLVHRYCRSLICSNKSSAKVLELGCGAGANIPFFLENGFEYYAIEGSPTIVEQLHKRYPSMASQILCGDFTSSYQFDFEFDLIFDRAALTHNNAASISAALNIACNSLRDNGIFIGVDWFSENHSDSTNGISVDDAHTRTHYQKGQFSEIGKVHFSNELHLRDLFSTAGITISFLEEKIVRRFEPSDNYQFASWNIVGSKAIG